MTGLLDRTFSSSFPPSSTSSFSGTGSWNLYFFLFDVLPVLVWLVLLSILPFELLVVVVRDDAGDDLVGEAHFVLSGVQSILVVSASPPPCSLLMTIPWLGAKFSASSWLPILSVASKM